MTFNLDNYESSETRAVDLTPELVRFETAEFTLDEAYEMGDVQVRVSVYRQIDGALVVQLDTDSLDGIGNRVRVNVNEGCVFDRNIETNEDFGDDL